MYNKTYIGMSDTLIDIGEEHELHMKLLLVKDQPVENQSFSRQEMWATARHTVLWLWLWRNRYRGWFYDAKLLTVKTWLGFVQKTYLSTLPQKLYSSNWIFMRLQDLPLWIVAKVWNVNITSWGSWWCICLFYACSFRPKEQRTNDLFKFAQ